MAPPVESWSARGLEERSQVSSKGRKRKDFDGDLKNCELLGLLQYKCEVERPVTRKSATVCWPVERLFRRCEDRERTFTVETTAWEEKQGD